MSNFGMRLRGFRDARGWSQERVGFELEVSKATVSKWETGRAEPGLRHLAKLLELYARDGLTLDYLVAGPPGIRPGVALHVNEPAAQTYDPAQAADEVTVVMRFRTLAPARRKGLLALLAE